MINVARTILTLQLSFSHSNCPGSRTCWQCSIGTQTPSVNRRSRRLNGLTSRHSDGGPTPCVHKALAEDPEFVVEIVQIALNNGSGTPRIEGAERENDAAGRSADAYGLLHEWPRSPGLDADGNVDADLNLPGFHAGCLV